MKTNPLQNMISIIRAFTGSKFVHEQVLEKLPRSIHIQFISEFDEKGDPVIFITSPDYEGIMSEARTMEEAVRNTHDAILTYFDVPRDCAKTIEFDVTETKQASLEIEDKPSVRERDFRLKLVHA